MPRLTTPDAPAPPRVPPAPPPAGGRLAWLRAAARDLARVVLPVECPGCGALDVPLCAACAALLGDPWRCEGGAPRLDRLDGRPPLPVWALAPYAGPVRGLVVAWKDRGRADLAPHLRDAARAAAERIAPALAAGLGGGRAAAARSGSGVVAVVPAPSTWASQVERGRVPVHELARGVVAGLRSAGVGAEVVTALAERRGRDQVGLGARARAANVRDRVRVRHGAGRCAGRPVLLVDDVLTTGATLAACEDALAARGAVVVGALVLAATPQPGPAVHPADPGPPHAASSLAGYPGGEPLVRVSGSHGRAPRHAVGGSAGPSEPSVGR